MPPWMRELTRRGYGSPTRRLLKSTSATRLQVQWFGDFARRGAFGRPAASWRHRKPSDRSLRHLMPCFPSRRSAPPTLDSCVWPARSRRWTGSCGLMPWREPRASKTRECLECSRLGSSVLASRLERVRCQAGTDYPELAPDRVTVLSDTDRVDDLIAHSVPFVVVETAGQAEQLVDVLGMKGLADAARFEVVPVLLRDPVPLADEFPPLRWYLPDDRQGLLLARCSELIERVETQAGASQTEKQFVLTPTTAYWVQTGSDLELLLRLRSELDLPVSEEDCRNIVSRMDRPGSRCEAGEAPRHQGFPRAPGRRSWRRCAAGEASGFGGRSRQGRRSCCRSRRACAGRLRADGPECPARVP